MSNQPVPMAFIVDLANKIPQEKLLAKYSISPETYLRWSNAKSVRDSLSLYRKQQVEVARDALTMACATAAANLIKLSGPEYKETGRKACLDILRIAGIEEALGGSIPAPEPTGDNEEDIKVDQAAQDAFILKVVNGGQK